MDDPNLVVWDKQTALSRLMNDESLLSTLISHFKELAPLTVQEIEQASQENDVNALQLHAHKIKGSALAVGALRVACLAKVIEEEARQDNAFASSEQLAQLTAEIDTFLVETA
ncbi:Hpt domain-containing protein [Methylophaga sp. OBS3]|uniref:Hpt domain-containing protein n=1 Tax=Methylophaga sp. OBS3 TaxID=2991934 RepID=UPI002257623D|nr:Hpt domain-containing protein [Methylophaga sp. OBS3]MCX4189247.1 Hpt domain-containing protein [Methylophaga sp. OBS3]